MVAFISEYILQKRSYSQKVIKCYCMLHVFFRMCHICCIAVASEEECFVHLNAKRRQFGKFSHSNRLSHGNI